MARQIDSPDSYYAPWEKTFGRILTPFEEFIHNQISGSVVLIVCAVIALVLANSPLADAYNNLLHMHITLNLGFWTLDHTLHHWINDGLMAVFFFFVGLEIKREALVGQLRDARAAVVPVVAAIGGMVVPALIYALFNFGGPGAWGWGVPMATDIAFALGVLALLGSRVPRALFVFLVTVAIVDDLGAVAVIAIFYTDQIVFGALGYALVFLAILIVLNLAGIRSPVPHFAVSVLLWVAMLESGIHATIAGVLAAWTVPGLPKLEPKRFSRNVRKLMDRFDELDRGRKTIIHNEQQRAIVQAIEIGVHKVESPLQRLEHGLHLPVMFLIVPLFALANAGVPIEYTKLYDILTKDPVTYGIILGLILGKLIGIAGGAWLTVKLGYGRLPDECNGVHMIGAALLAGIGFTMSIFVAELAFREAPELLISAKTGILFGSLAAGAAGYFILRKQGEGASTKRRKARRK